MVKTTKKKESTNELVPSKGIIYYTNNQLNMRMALTCRKYIADSGLPVVCVSSKPTNFGVKNIVHNSDGKAKEMFEKILLALEASTTDIIFFCESDDLYHKSYFDFTPDQKNTFYYNGNYWYLRMSDGFAIHYDVTPLSGLVAYRKQLIKHFKERLALINKQGYSSHMGYEPMTHLRIKWKTTYGFAVWLAKVPTVDFCHGGNLSWKRWRKDQFLKKPMFWDESDYKHIPGWPDLPGIISRFFPIKK